MLNFIINPTYVSEKFHKPSNIHSPAASEILHRYHCLNCYWSTNIFRVFNIWNNLDDKLKVCFSLKIFKNIMKKQFLPQREIYIYVMVIGPSWVQFGLNHASDWQNRTTAKRESDSLVPSMITDRIGEEVLLPINHSHFHFRKKQIHLEKKWLQWRQ